MADNRKNVQPSQSQPTPRPSMAAQLAQHQGMSGGVITTGPIAPTPAPAPAEDAPLTQDQLIAQLAEAQAENERLRQAAAAATAKAGRQIYMKVSEKGAASLYGMGRFPVTLYVEQWLTILDMDQSIRKFLEDNKATLKTKEQAAAAQ